MGPRPGPRTVDPMIDGGNKYEEEKGTKASKRNKKFRTEEEEDEEVVEGFMVKDFRLDTIASPLPEIEPTRMRLSNQAKAHDHLGKPI
ncbi:unnamed protein product, partial [Dovyalis caffra]